MVTISSPNMYFALAQSWDMYFNENKWTCRYLGKGYLTLRFLHIIQECGVTFPVLPSKVLAPEPRLRISMTACTLPNVPLCVFWFHYSDYIITTIQLLFCIEFWNLWLLFYFLLYLSKIVPMFLKGSGKWISPYSYLSRLMVRKEFTRNVGLDVGGDLIKLDSVWFSILWPLTARS
jgi:hypothetical protein